MVTLKYQKKGVACRNALTVVILLATPCNGKSRSLERQMCRERDDRTPLWRVNPLPPVEPASVHFIKLIPKDGESFIKLLRSGT